jgi:hypothetical protein
MNQLLIKAAIVELVSKVCDIHLHTTCEADVKVNLQVGSISIIVGHPSEMLDYFDPIYYNTIYFKHDARLTFHEKFVDTMLDLDKVFRENAIIYI